ncbi:MAG: hypothetical protein ABIL01_32275 [Pseudomonadota bacterium]
MPAQIKRDAAPDDAAELRADLAMDGDPAGIVIGGGGAPQA